jgi:membrane protease YdiL (CAAX protease family)
LITGFTLIMVVLWLPTHEQLIFGPIALVTPLVLTLVRWPGREKLGLGWRTMVRAWWIVPAAAGFTLVSVLIARGAGTFHSLYEPYFAHVGGYVVWTIYQQFLLQDFFMPRLQRMMTSDRAIAVAASLFAVAHLPNLSLTLATLVWGVVSCLLFRRYRSLWMLGLAQGLLGICFAICIPNALHHHMRVGLGYMRYHPVEGQVVGYHPPAR